MNAGFFVSPSLGRTLSLKAVVCHPHLGSMKALGLAQCWVGLGYSGDQDRPCPSLWSSQAGRGDTQMIVQVSTVEVSAAGAQEGSALGVCDLCGKGPSEQASLRI